MKKRWRSVLTVVGVALIFIGGCKTKQVKKTAPPPEKKVVIERPKDLNYSWQGFPQPAPTPQDAKILIEKRIPRKSKPNQEFTFTIDVRNNADFAVTKLVLTERIPAGFKMIRSTPSPDKKKGMLVWDLGALRPGQKRTISVSGKISSPGAARYFGDTDLNFDLEQSESVVEVIQPKLEFYANYPKSVIITEKIPVELSFKNSGKAPVLGTKLIQTLPKGLLTYEGKSKIDIWIGDLQPGQTKNHVLDLRAEKTGNYKITLVAVADEGISAKTDVAFKVTKPELQISGDAPRKRFVGNIISYNIDVKNVGDANTKEVRIKMNLPEGTSLTSADEGGQAVGNSVVWKIKSLYPGEKKKVVAKVVANKIMTARVVATAETLGTEPVEAVMVTDVAGVAALLGRLIDINDPVPLGENEIYEITVTNQGSLPATKIKVKCYLEDTMEFVKSTGATKSTLKGKVLTFNPLPALAPHSEAKWRVHVKALKEGDVRFTIKIESDQLTRPVEILEATHFYE